MCEDYTALGNKSSFFLSHSVQMATFFHNVSGMQKEKREWKISGHAMFPVWLWTSQRGALLCAHCAQILRVVWGSLSLSSMKHVCSIYLLLRARYLGFCLLLGSGQKNLTGSMIFWRYSGLLVAKFYFKCFKN